MQDSASFWTDIKTFEEQLAKSPDSFCFARLSDVYLKVGLVEDALHVARQGVSKHPGYISGQRAFAMACHAKGLNEEAVTALLLVTEALPEDVPSQIILGRLQTQSGNREAACHAFRTALEFEPDDMECRIELESLERSTALAPSSLETDDDDDLVIEDLEILEELDIVEDDDSETEFPETPVVLKVETVVHHDPLSTGTLAELYVKQGFIHKALEIYRAILADNPSDLVTGERVAELEILETAPSEPDTEIDCSYGDDVEDEPAFCTPPESSFQETVPGVESELSSGRVADTLYLDVVATGYEVDASVVPTSGTADSALATLGGWLENIRRIKSCR